MDITFITMHDLTADARLLYASDSIIDVLGYGPTEVIGKPAFEFFHPSSLVKAHEVHTRGVKLDKAAVLEYCTLKRADDSYVRCECVFTVVYSVIVACVSLYRHTNKSHDRAVLAPLVRHSFTSGSEHDPRYHMLTHLSTKFTTQPSGRHEPRSAIILNRFSRTLTIMYATHALADILDIAPDDAVGMSFYEFVQQDCLQSAVDCLEQAKENDSIAYLRFRWRDPRLVQQQQRDSQNRPGTGSLEAGLLDGPVEGTNTHADGLGGIRGYGNSQSETMDVSYGDDGDHDRATTPQSGISAGTSTETPVEVEAVVSCTSDGLVVILRRARDFYPQPEAAAAARTAMFASPWALTPLMPKVPVGDGIPTADFMENIREVAVFAWSLRSINENLMQYAPSDSPLPDAIEHVGAYEHSPSSLRNLRPTVGVLERKPQDPREDRYPPDPSAGHENLGANSGQGHRLGDQSYRPY